MAKTTTRQIGISSIIEFHSTLDQVADLTIKRDKAQTKLDKAILAAREEHSGDLDELNNQIAAKMIMLEQFATQNRAELFSGNTKSADTQKARYGFRLGLPTLKLLSKKFTWKTVMSKLQKLKFTQFITTADPKPDKDKLKADLSAEQLASIGLRIDQTESFWIEPKTDSAERINA